MDCHDPVGHLVVLEKPLVSHFYASLILIFATFSALAAWEELAFNENGFCAGLNGVTAF